MNRFFLIWLIFCQFYWFPGIDLLVINGLKYLGAIFLFLNSYGLRDGKKPRMLHMFVIVVFCVINFKLGAQVFLIFLLYYYSHSIRTYGLGKIELVLLLVFLLPSWSFIFKAIGNLYIPYLHFDVHYDWIKFHEIGFSGVSTGYGYSLFFLLYLFLYSYEGYYKKTLLILIGIAVLLSGSLLSILASSLLVVGGLLRLPISIWISIFGFGAMFLGRDTIVLLANERFEQYPILFSLDLKEALVLGSDDFVYGDLSLHNGFINVILDYGLFGLFLVIVLIRNVFKEVVRKGLLMIPVFIVTLYNCFEPSNILGNWVSIIPFWLIYFNKDVRYSFYKGL